MRGFAVSRSTAPAVPHRARPRGKPCRAYSWDWLVDRYGEPDPDAVRLLTVAVECLQIGAGIAVWEVMFQHPSIRTADGSLAIDTAEFAEKDE